MQTKLATSIQAHTPVLKPLEGAPLKLSVIALSLLAISVLTIKLFSVEVFFAPKPKPLVLENEKIAELHPGEEVPQIFTFKVPFKSIKPGIVGFEVIDQNWRHPVWFPALVKPDGYVYCPISVGTKQDTCRWYKITGKVLPPNTVVEPGKPMDIPLPGDEFYSSLHRRL